MSSDGGRGSDRGDPVYSDKKGRKKQERMSVIAAIQLRIQRMHSAPSHPLTAPLMDAASPTSPAA